MENRLLFQPRISDVSVFTTINNFLDYDSDFFNLQLSLINSAPKLRLVQSYPFPIFVLILIMENFKLGFKFRYQLKIFKFELNLEIWFYLSGEFLVFSKDEEGGVLSVVFEFLRRMRGLSVQYIDSVAQKGPI